MKNELHTTLVITKNLDSDIFLLPLQEFEDFWYTTKQEDTLYRVFGKSMYKDELIDHYRYPRNFGRLVNPTHSIQYTNPLCGDSLTVDMDIDGDSVDGICRRMLFEGKGCVISQAAASLVIERFVGKSVSELQALTSSDVTSLLGIEIGPVRLKCALLIVEALRNITVVGAR